MEGFRYHAFISYSHADEAWARWLHRAIETYRVPARLHRLSAGAIPERLFPVFRDRDELPSAAELGAVIQQALRDSRTLIVICSPRSATSRWVNEEIRYFKSLGRERQVFALIVDGEPHAKEPAQECFAEALRHALAEDGSVSPDDIEPIAADARDSGDGRRGALLKLVSGLLGVGFDELKQRDARRRLWQRLGVAALVAAVALSLLSVWQWQLRERQSALDAQALKVRRATLYENGRRELLAGQQARAAVYLVGALELGLDTPALRFMLGRAMREVDSFQQRYEVGAPVTQLRVDPSDKRLAVLDDDGTLHVLDTESGRTVSARKGEHPDWSDGPYFAQDGRVIALNVLSRGHSTAELLLGATEATDWNERRPSSAQQFDISVSQARVAYVDEQERAHVVAIDGSGFEKSYGAASAIRLSEDSLKVYVGRGDGAVRRLEASSGELLVSYPGLGEAVQALRESPDGQLLAAAGVGGEVRVWEAASGKLRFTAGQARQVRELEFSADSRRLRTSGQDGNSVWDTRRGQLLLADKASNFLGNPAAFVFGGEWLAQIKDGNLILTDAATGQPLLDLDGHIGPPNTFASTQNPRVLYSGGDDGSIVRWQLPAANRAVFDLPNSSAELEGDSQVPASYSHRGDLFAFGRADGLVELHRSADGSLVRTLVGGHGRVTALGFAPDDQSLAVGDQTGQVAVWKLSGDSTARELDLGSGATALLRWAPDGRHLAAAFLGARTRVWAWPEASVAAEFYPRDATRALAFSPDGHRLAIGQAGHAKLWDFAKRKFVWDQVLPVNDGEKSLANVFDFRADGLKLFASLFRRQLFILDAVSGRIDAAAQIASSNSFSSGAFSFDQSSIVIGDYSKLAYRWAPQAGRAVNFEGHTAAVGSAVMHPNGALIATGSDDGTVKVWEADSGALLDTVAHHRGPVRYENVGFDHDGQTLISAGQDQRVLLTAVPLDLRKVEDLQSLVGCKSRWFLNGEILEPQHQKATDCGSR